MNPQPVTALVRAWVDLYTRGLPEGPRATRRDEVDDDLWCHHEEALAGGRSTASVRAEMLARLLFGMPADVSWRMSSGRAAAPDVRRASSTGVRILGVLAIVGALGWGIAAVGYLVLGEDAWLTQGLLMYVSQLFGGLGFAGAAIGIAMRFQDRFSVIGAIAGVLGGLCALLGAMGAYQLSLLLPVGSAVMGWELGRARILPRPLAIVHTVSAVFVLPLLLGFVGEWDTTVVSVGLLALIFPYLLSWLGIGVWLIGGVPLPIEAKPAPPRP